MPQETSRSRAWTVFALAVGLALVVAGVMLAAREQGISPEQPPTPDTPSADVSAPRPDSQAQAARRSGADPVAADEDVEGLDLDMDQDMIAVRWAQVDLDALREEMPDNLYWKLGAPTSDPAVERERAEERARWNEAYGKVLSGTASEEEIHAYYDQRARLSADYVEFASRLLETYREVLPARDVGLLELSLKMHHARLQQMPRRLTEALERKQRQDRLREAWLADEAAFERAQADEAQRAVR